MLQSDQDRIWEAFQGGPAEVFAGSRGRLAYLARRVRGVGRVLNIGVGGGQFEEEALARGIEVYSLDPSQSAIEKLRQRLGLAEDRARVGHAQKIPFVDGFFGAVVASEVLEHLEPAEVPSVLAEICRVLAPGGFLAGTVPARENLAEQHVVCPHCGERFHRWGHRQAFEPAQLRALLSANFKIEQLRETPFVTWRTLNWKGRLLGFAKLLLWRLGIHGSGEFILFMARRRLG